MESKLRVSTHSNWRDSKTRNSEMKIAIEIRENSQFMFTHRTIASESDVIAFFYFWLVWRLHSLHAGCVE